MVDALAKAAMDTAGNGGPMWVVDDISYVAGVEQAVIRIAAFLADGNVRFDTSKFYGAFDRSVQSIKDARRVVK